MPAVTPTTLQTAEGNSDGSVLAFSWELLTASPAGAPMSFVQWSDRTWTAVGTWGGATLAFEGSNDLSNWFAMNNAAGGLTASLTANGMVTTIELPLYVRPNLITAGTEADVVVSVCARRANPQRS